MGVNYKRRILGPDYFSSEIPCCQSNARPELMLGPGIVLEQVCKYQGDIIEVELRLPLTSAHTFEGS